MRLRSLVPVMGLLFAADLALANGPEIGFDGGSIVPLASTDVRLVRETVELHAPLTDDYEPGRAECVYELLNLSSRPRTLAMSFVGGWNARWSPDESPHGAPPVRVRVDGRETAVRMERARPASWAEFGVDGPQVLPVWNVTLPPRDSVMVQVDYEIHWSGGSDGSSDGREMTYHARPARLWAGTIRDATFTLHLGTVTTALLRDRAINMEETSVKLRIVPADLEWTADGLRWRRRDWEPDHDFRFHVSWDVPESFDE